MTGGATGAAAGAGLASATDGIGAIKRSGAVDKAYTNLVRRLDLREVLPGDRLPAATELASQIGVSRVAVLQALQVLQSEGRLIVRPGRGGARVAPRAASRDLRFALQWAVRGGLKDLHPFYEVIVQGVGGHLARHGMQRDEIAEARSLLDEIEAVQDDDDARLAAENRFFAAIGRATGTKMLELMVVLARQHFSALFDLLDIPADRPRKWIGLERELLRAIEQGETGTASDAMSAIFGDVFALARIAFDLGNAPSGAGAAPANGPSNGQSRATTSRKKLAAAKKGQG